MFFAKIARLGRGVAVRLTLTYAGIFATSALALAAVLYGLLRSNVTARIDDDLRSDCNELRAVLADQGLAAVQLEFAREAGAEGVSHVFLRLLDADGRVLASSDAAYWRRLFDSGLKAAPEAGAPPTFATYDVPGHRRTVRVMQAFVAPGMVAQIGRSLHHDERLLRGFERSFVLTMLAVLAVATLSGWFLARRAMAGVQEVTQTAIGISRGAFELRVPLRGSGDEIDRMAGAFNDMLQRIQTLVRGMREITDNVAHDLRSPIARMRGAAEMALTAAARREPGADTESLAADTVEECDRLLGIINTMLAISEAETGMGELRLSDFDLAETVRDVCELFAPVAEEKGVALRVSGSGPAPVRGDLQKIQRALSDLVDNALKYTPRGGEVEVAASFESDRAVASVRDTGVGIAESDLLRIFERFYRADESRSQPGNGLGLSLARALARAHGGDVTVASAPGAGSTFRIALPRRAGRIETCTHPE